jgi:hypothetical protein
MGLGAGGPNVTKIFEELLDKEETFKTIILVCIFGELFQNNIVS